MAQPKPTPRERARVMFQAGNTAYVKGQYKQALALFLEAKKLYPSSGRIALHLAITYEELGQLAVAAESFEKYLKLSDPNQSSAEVTRVNRDVQRRLRKLRRKLGSVWIQCNVERAAVLVDKQMVGSTPLTHRIYRKPGTYRVAVEREGYASFGMDLMLVRGKHQTLKVDLVKAAVEPSKLVPPPTTPTPGPTDVATSAAPGRPKLASTPVYKRWWFWTIIGAAVLGGTTAVLATQRGGDDRMPRAG